MTDWYAFKPVDTLFFKGAEPMVMGENHTVSSSFPPPPHTIAGALRTMLLKQHGISFEDYGNGNAPSAIFEMIGKAGEKAPFEVLGPLFFKDKALYVPAPYSWFAHKEDLEKKEGTVNVYKSALIKTSLVKTKVSQLLWAKGDKGELVSIGGNWINEKDLHSDNISIEIFNSDHFFAIEPRTGIALHKNRRVRDGHLYTFNHARLKKDVLLVFGVDQKLPLNEMGILALGGEQRFGFYRHLNDIAIGKIENRQYFVSLSLVEGTTKTNNAVVATGKIQYIGGWDFNRGFHKPMKGFFPAGTVFNEQLNQNFLAI